jgi:hypothetical protein
VPGYEWLGEEERQALDRRRYVGEVRRVLDGRLGIPVPLDDDALGLIVVEVGVVLQRSGVLGPHDLIA